MIALSPSRAALAAALTAALLLAACSSGNNKNTGNNSNTNAGVRPTQTPTRAAIATPPAAGAGGATPNTVAATPGPGTVVVTTPPPPATPSPDEQAAADKLKPLLLAQQDLPAEMKAWQGSPPATLSNGQYVQARPERATLEAQLKQTGRVVTVATGWAAPGGGNVTAATRTALTFSDFLAQYASVDGAKTACDFVFSQAQPTSTNASGDTSRVTPLTIDPTGDDFKAIRIDYEYTGVVGTPPPQPARLKQVFFVACWRHGTVVPTVLLVSLGQDPSLDDFKQLIKAQDGKLP